MMHYLIEFIIRFGLPLLAFGWGIYAMLLSRKAMKLAERRLKHNTEE